MLFVYLFVADENEMVEMKPDMMELGNGPWVKSPRTFVFLVLHVIHRGEICQCRQCRRQCKIFASGVNFSIFTNFLCFFLLKLLKLGEIDGVKFLA